MSFGTYKVALVCGAARDVGLQAAITIANRLPQDSRIFLTSIDPNVDRRTEKLRRETGNDRLKYLHLDLTERRTLDDVADAVAMEGNLDILVNNCQRYWMPPVMNDKKFLSITLDTLRINYFGLKSICEKFIDQFAVGARVVNITSHLGHLSNIDGMEPHASTLRDRFANKNLTEDQLDVLVGEFTELAEKGNGNWYQAGWPSCPFTVSKIAVNAYSRVLQKKLDVCHAGKDVAVNALHHGRNNKNINAYRVFSAVQAGELVAGIATLPEGSNVRGKVVWRGTYSFDNWQYGGLDDDNKLEKTFVKVYDMEEEINNLQYEMNSGFCLDG